MFLKFRYKHAVLVIIYHLVLNFTFLTGQDTVTEVVFSVSNNRGSTVAKLTSIENIHSILDEVSKGMATQKDQKDAQRPIRQNSQAYITDTGRKTKIRNRKRHRTPMQQNVKVLNETKVDVQDKSEAVVYVTDSAGYIPMTPVRGPNFGLAIATATDSPATTPSSIASIPSMHSIPPVPKNPPINNEPTLFYEDSNPNPPVIPHPPPTTDTTGDGDLTAAGFDWKAPTIVNGGMHDVWDREYRRFRFNNTKVQHIEAECQDDYMKIRIGFNGSFAGLLYSAGYAYDPDCMYINGTGKDYYEFYIQLNRCGTLGKNSHSEDTRKNPTKNFMWNTITVQYNPLIEEEFDEHFKVTCEYGYDFWKTVTFPFLDVEVATGNPVVFTLTPPECYMEIRYGYGTQGNRVTGPVRVGDPLTLIIYMRSKYDGFDIVVNDCYAHNGATKKIQLIDEYGCPVDDKLISRFRGSWSDSGVFETQVFAYMKTFRFTGSPALYIECDVRMCHGRCPSQPCHWRNAKTKRSINITEEVTTAQNHMPSLSDNINLFQSLRVLQEGENNESELLSEAFEDILDSNVICMKSGILSAISTVIVAIIFALSGVLITTCNRLKRHKHSQVSPKKLFHGYMNHKGNIN